MSQTNMGEPNGGLRQRLLALSKIVLPLACCLLIIMGIVTEHVSNPSWFPSVSYVSAPRTLEVFPTFNNSGVVVSKDDCRCRYLYRNKNFTDNSTKFGDVFFQGRLGNIMFQYSALYCVSRTNGLVPLLYEKQEITKYFPFLDAKMSPKEKPGEGFKGFSENKFMAYDKRTMRFFEHRQNIHLFGFYQSWKYCHPYRDEIREHFTFAQTIRTKAEAFLESLHRIYGSSDIAINGTLTYIGLHIRRGDFIREDKTKLGYWAVDDAYLKKAMKHFSALFPNAVYVVTTDDTSWAKDHVKSDSGKVPVVFSPFREPEVDMCLMSKCNHTVMSTGTFSWWAAWLADGLVVYPKVFPKTDSWLGKGYVHEDYYMPHWKGL